MSIPHRHTEKEKSILNQTTDIWNNWLLMSGRLSDEDQDVRTAIHTIQRVIALRLARRVDPETWGAGT
jgi:hypothetical protein